MTDEAMSPLRWRMIEDMTIRKFAPKTQHDYVQRGRMIVIETFARGLMPRDRPRGPMIAIRIDTS